MATLGDTCDIKLNFPEADFWVIPTGTDIGNSVKTFKPELIGVKVTATDILVPGYLYYVFQWLKGQGKFDGIAYVRPSDLKKMVLQPTEGGGA
jgi:hypothetical protein